MKTEPFDIDSIPAILYGEPSKQGYLFLHGQMGRKEEAAAFAQWWYLATPTNMCRKKRTAFSG